MTTNPVPSSDREIVTSRLIRYPRDLVFRAWLEPDHLARWWGPRGFTNTFEEFDFRPEGLWRFVMHGPDGKDYKNESVFVEIRNPERIVFDHVSGHLYRGTATFEEVEDGTRVSWRMMHESSDAARKIRPLAVPANEENFDRLEAELSWMAADPACEFAVSRFLPAPPERAFGAWTDPDQLRQWFGPSTFTIPVCETDPRVNGAFRIVMRGDDGTDYPMTAVYREVSEPHRLEFAADLNEHPFEWKRQMNGLIGAAPDTPLPKMPATVTFRRHNGGTEMTVLTHFASPAVLDAMVETGLEDGWSQTLDRLEALMGR